MSRPPTPCFVARKTWVPGTRPGMTIERLCVNPTGISSSGGAHGRDEVEEVAAKLNLVILVALAGGMLWIEHAHRITIEASAPAEVAGREAASCPEKQS